MIENNTLHSALKECSRGKRIWEKPHNFRNTNTNSGIYLQHAHTYKLLSKTVNIIHTNIHIHTFIYIRNDSTYLMLCLK